MPVVWDQTFTVPPDTKGGLTGIKIEDHGRAMIMYDPLEMSDEENGFFVRFHSWAEEPNESAAHEFFKMLMGKRVRLTIETLD